eukprot:4907691-Prymnesium_polylepis.1
MLFWNVSSNVKEVSRLHRARQKEASVGTLYAKKEVRSTNTDGHTALFTRCAAAVRVVGCCVRV